MVYLVLYHVQRSTRAEGRCFLGTCVVYGMGMPSPSRSLDSDVISRHCGGVAALLGGDVHLGVGSRVRFQATRRIIRNFMQEKPSYSL